MAHTPGTFLEFLGIAVARTNAEINALQEEQKADMDMEYNLILLRERVSELMKRAKTREAERDRKISALREELDVMEEIRKHITGEATQE